MIQYLFFISQKYPFSYDSKDKKSPPVNAGISELLPGLSRFWVLIWKLLSRGAGTFLKSGSLAPLPAFGNQV